MGYESVFSARSDESDGTTEDRGDGNSSPGAGAGAGSGDLAGPGPPVVAEFPVEADPDVELPDPESPDDALPDDVDPVESPAPGLVGVEPDGGLLGLDDGSGLVAGAEPAGLPDVVGCGVVGGVVGWGVVAGAAATGRSCAGTAAAGPGRAGQGVIDAEDSLIAGAAVGSVIPGRGGAAPIRAAWAAGLGVIAAGPLAPVAGLTAESAAGPVAGLTADAVFAGRHPEPRFVPVATAECPAGAPAAGSALRPEVGETADGAPSGARVPVPNRLEAGPPASTLELA